MQTWSGATWSTLFDTYARLGISEVIIQWIDYRDSYEYDPPAPMAPASPMITPDVLAVILREARQRGMHVTMGNVFLNSYWERIKSQPHLIKVHLMRIREATRRQLAPVAPLLANNPAFVGWYIAQEVDDRTWFDPERKKILSEFLTSMREDMQAVASGPVAISAFANGWASPETVGNFWREVADQSGIRRVLFQDGVGVGKLTLAEVPLYLEALHKALAGSGCTIQPVAEIFVQQPGERFSAVAAPVNRVLQQLDTEAPYAPAGIMLFSVTEYASPLGGAEAEALLHGLLTESHSKQE